MGPDLFGKGGREDGNGDAGAGRFAALAAAVFFTALGMYFRFRGLANRELWCDERFQLSFAAEAFRPIWRRIPLGDGTCFPGEYVLTYPFGNLFGDNKWLINIPHIIAAFLTFYFMYLLCRRYMKTWVGFAVAFIVLCFNGNLVYHSFEFRPYAVLPMMSLASLYFSVSIVSGPQKMPVLKRILISLFFIFTVTYHAYGIIIAGLSMLYAVIAAKSEERSYAEIARDTAPFLLPTGSICAILFAWYASGTMSHVNIGYCQSVGMDTFQYYPNPLCDVCRFFRQVFSNLMAHKQFGQKHLALGIWASFLLPDRGRLSRIGFFLLLVVLPIMLILLADTVSGYWFLDRQFVWVMSLYALFLGLCWDAIYSYARDFIKGWRVAA